MQKNTTVFIMIGLLVLAVGAGLVVRYEVLRGRTMAGPVPVTDFTSCLDSGGSLNVTGTICTSLSGQIYLKPGTVNAPSTPTPVTSATTTASSTTSSTSTALTFTLKQATTFRLGDSKTLSDGPTVTLVSISDSRCKPNVQCIWAGEFSTTWQLTTAAGTKTLTLGTVRQTAEIQPKYTYTLIQATATSASLIVTKTEASVTSGIVTGTVTIGPICPVESIDHPCTVPPETYTSRSVIVYAADHTTELEQHALTADGKFTLTLRPGIYGLQIRPAGIGAGEIKTITIIADKTSNVDFAIDTGIR